MYLTRRKMIPRSNWRMTFLASTTAASMILETQSINITASPLYASTYCLVSNLHSVFLANLERKRNSSMHHHSHLANLKLVYSVQNLPPSHIDKLIFLQVRHLPFSKCDQRNWIFMFSNCLIQVLLCKSSKYTFWFWFVVIKLANFIWTLDSVMC